MNITTFKKLVRPHGEVEKKRLQDLTRRSWKYLTFHHFGKSVDDLEESEISKLWHVLNIKLAEQDKFHRAQTHSMRTSKTTFYDYSHLAYNGVTKDF